MNRLILKELRKLNKELKQLREDRRASDSASAQVDRSGHRLALVSLFVACLALVPASFWSTAGHQVYLAAVSSDDFVENPSQVPLQHGAIRLTAGGGLFALPIVYEAMTETVGSNGANATSATLNAVDFDVS